MGVRHISRAHEPFPLGRHPLGFLAGLEAICFLEGGFMLLPKSRLQRLQLLRRGNPAVDQTLCVHGLRTWMLVDLLVQDGLRILGCIRLVVTKAPVANNIHNDIGLPGLAPLGSQLESARHSHRVVAIYVQDGEVEALAEIRGVERGSVIHGIRCETHLVVDDHMNCAPNVEFLNMSQLHGFIDDALPGERRIAVEEDGKNSFPGLGSVAKVELLGPCTAQCDGVDCLQVRRVRFQCGCHRGASLEAEYLRGSKMILHIPREEPVVLVALLHQLLEVVVGALELSEHLNQWLSHHVGQDVQAPPVRHANDALRHAEAGSLLDSSVHT
mmetsp:Transcript_42886/g.96271  ORF Transcript_42886/g.96271 Transcript_42886/m.96271 type:complete len:327 (-) Transcript_42886:113-1093(-)